MESRRNIPFEELEPWIQRSLIALRLAAQDARELAERTGTPYITRETWPEAGEKKQQDTPEAGR